MRKLFLFMMVSLDGFFEGPGHDLSWHHVDEEFNDFATRQLKEADTILFGRRTYQLMESFWPSSQALEDDPKVAKLMNETPKIVISKSLKEVKETKYWKNIELFNQVSPKQIYQLKNQTGKDIIVLGSSNLCVSLIKLGLLDELRIMINPVVIGNGTRLFAGLNEKLNLTVKRTKTFGNGNILIIYKLKK